MALRRLMRFKGSEAGVWEASRRRKRILRVMPFPSRAWTPITKKRPARTPWGIRWSTTSRGPVMVPRVRRP